MDEIKDIQTSAFLKFLDQDMRTNPFGENKSAERAYRRAERLVAAIFLLTNHIPADEPIRRQIRRASPVLLDQILDLRDDLRSGTSEKIHTFQASVRRLISLVKLLVFSGFISSQNAEAATEALDELGNFIIAAQRSNLSDAMRFSREDLLDVRNPERPFIKDIKDKKVITDKKDITDISTMSVTTPSTVRASNILGILRTGADFNIRDIAAHIPEYSEKTIQRELIDLMSQGLVRRSGLKRWSRYALVQ